jgi:isoquinoline 1-oxidoreductase subunit beta
MTIDHQINRRQFMIATATVGGGLMLGFFLPSRRAAAATMASQPWTAPTASGAEVNAWLIIGSDDTVTIRVAQSEMGEGVFTSMPMLVAEELECDWQTVRAEYASANRSLRENRVYQRMATGGSGAVRRRARSWTATPQQCATITRGELTCHSIPKPSRCSSNSPP